jgi:anti-sigma B factor antagonist
MGVMGAVVGNRSAYLHFSAAGHVFRFSRAFPQHRAEAWSGSGWREVVLTGEDVMGLIDAQPKSEKEALTLTGTAAVTRLHSVAERLELRRYRAPSGSPGFRITGTLDLRGSEDLWEALGSGLGGSIELDLEGVDFMDSTGLGMLVRIARGLGSENGELTLVNPSRQVIRLLRLTGVDGMPGLKILWPERDSPRVVDVTDANEPETVSPQRPK